MNTDKDRHISSLAKTFILLATILFLCPGTLRAEERDSVIVSLLTCAPGPEVYELCGHEAVRVRGEGIDSVWNYGLFDFTEPNFIYRFVKGETDYMLGAFPFRQFMAEYVWGGRTVTEQDLNLTREEARRLLGMLRTESLPANRTYRYNYVRDNCATRIVDRLDQAAGERIIYPDSIKYGTFRKAMRSYHRNYPWYQFGIDLALGSGIDVPVTGREEMFAPPEMMEKVAGAHFADGRPLVAATRILFQGQPDATLPPTPFWETPMAAAVVLLLLTIGLAAWQIRRRKVFATVYSVWFGILGTVGCVVAFLVFISEHEATSPNVLLLWLNPLQLIAAFAPWWRSWRKVMLALMAYNIIIPAVMLAAWPFQNQCTDPALFLLMGVTLILAASYAIITVKYSYNYSVSLKHNSSKNEQVSNIGTRRTGKSGRSGSGGSRTAKARGGDRR